MIKTNSIDHVCLWVYSLTDSKTYYEKVFCFSCSYRDEHENTLIVESDDVHFFLCEYREKNDLINKQHISFNVDSLDKVVQSLISLGITDYKQGKVDCFSDKNYKWCEWRDPSGIRLECVELI